MCSNTLSSIWTEMHFILRLSVSPCQSPNGSPASRSCGDQITSRFNTWTTTLSWEYAWHSERMLGTTRWLLRMWTARIPWKSKLSFSVSLLNVRGKIEVTEVPKKMQEKRFQWFGYCFKTRSSLGLSVPLYKQCDIAPLYWVVAMLREEKTIIVVKE